MGTRRRLAGAVIFLCSVAGLVVLSPSTPAQTQFTSSQSGRPFEYTRTVWRISDGLPEDTVQTLVESREGVLWIGTTGGLTRFDG